VQADQAIKPHVRDRVEQIRPLRDPMERSARRLCVAMLFWRRPTWALDRLWPAVHGVERALLPAMRELVTLLMARGRPVGIRIVEQPPGTVESVEQTIGLARHQTWVRPGSDADRRLEAAIRERLTEREGRLAFDWSPSYLGLVTWAPGGEPVPDA
jgi:hypothetical protein